MHLTARVGSDPEASDDPGFSAIRERAAQRHTKSRSQILPYSPLKVLRNQLVPERTVPQRPQA